MASSINSALACMISVKSAGIGENEPVFINTKYIMSINPVTFGAGKSDVFLKHGQAIRTNESSIEVANKIKECVDKK